MYSHKIENKTFYYHYIFIPRTDEYVDNPLSASILVQNFTHDS